MTPPLLKRRIRLFTKWSSIMAFASAILSFGSSLSTSLSLTSTIILH